MSRANTFSSPIHHPFTFVPVFAWCWMKARFTLESVLQWKLFFWFLPFHLRQSSLRLRLRAGGDRSAGGKHNRRNTSMLKFNEANLRGRETRFVLGSECDSRGRVSRAHNKPAYKSPMHARRKNALRRELHNVLWGRQSLSNFIATDNLHSESRSSQQFAPTLRFLRRSKV